MPQVRLDIPDDDHTHVRAAAALVGLTVAEFCAKAAAQAARRQLKESADHLPHDTKR
jgi:uncharacterized protein (DUF1778 family)